MNRFARTLTALLLAVPAMIFAGATTALAVPPPDDYGYGLPPVTTTSVTTVDATSWADRLQWMAAGAGFILAIAIVFVAVMALVRRHQQTSRPVPAS